MNYKLTILITVFNSKKYLIRCADALVNQSCSKDKYEVIMVDDGSTDGAEKICDEYAKKYKNFKVIHQEPSGGPSTGRNKGIDLAKSKYIFFCDEDDYFGPLAIEKMIEHLYEWNPDVMLAKMGSTSGRGFPKSMFKENKENVSIYDSTIARTIGPWKAFNVEFLRKNKIYFPVDVTQEDACFTFKAYFLAKKISIASDYTYYYWDYRDDGTNLTLHKSKTSSEWGKIDKRIKAFKIITDVVDKYNDKTKNQSEIRRKLMNIIIETLGYALTHDCTEEQFKELKNITNSWYDEKFKTEINLSQYILLIAFRSDLTIFKTKKIYYLVNKNNLPIIKEQDRYFVLLDMIKKGFKLDVSEFIVCNNTVILNSFKKDNKNLVFNFEIYADKINKATFNITPNNGDDSVSYKLKLKGNNKDNITKVSKLDQLYKFFPYQTAEVKVNLNDLFNYKFKNDESITFNMKIEFNDISKNIICSYENLFDYAFSNKNSIIIPDTRSNSAICFRYLNSNTDLKKCDFITHKKKKINNKFIFEALYNSNYNLALDVVKAIENKNIEIKYSLLKKYMIFYDENNKKYVLKNPTYKNIFIRTKNFIKRKIKKILFG